MARRRASSVACRMGVIRGWQGSVFTPGHLKCLPGRSISDRQPCLPAVTAGSRFGSLSKHLRLSAACFANKRY